MKASFNRFWFIRAFVLAFCVLPVTLASAQSRRGDGPRLYPPGQGKTVEDNFGDDPAWIEQSEQLLYKLQLLEEEIARLSGIVEEQSIRLRRMSEEQKQRYLDLDQRIGEVAQSASAPATQQAARAPAGSPEQEAYKKARELAQQKRFEDSIEAFNQVVRQYPRGAVAANSLYWVGELYLLLPKPEVEKSRQTFVQLIERFPNNRRVPTALYKLGTIHDQLGQKEESDQYFERVMREFPSSSASRLAINYRSNRG